MATQVLASGSNTTPSSAFTLSAPTLVFLTGRDTTDSLSATAEAALQVEGASGQWMTIGYLRGLPIDQSSAVLPAGKYRTYRTRADSGTYGVAHA